MAWFSSLFAGLLKSRTVWVNVLALIMQGIGHVSGVLPPEWAPYVTMALAVLNLILRFLTTTPIVPGPTPAPNPAPSTAPQWFLWLRDILDAIARKEIPLAEGEALAAKVLTKELADAKKESEVVVT